MLITDALLCLLNTNIKLIEKNTNPANFSKQRIAESGMF
ncbi:hypothetical protein SAMN05421682_11049 [Chryseobacterium indoltheticum]|uniref:Uncharacterized protein n=1 Tax=Chryseobacterium indoltheticum TaxID=254 RepID=A0A381FB73_9FLAO|nr:hypothetical protein SAMN05421682_11049 [Chryseobacterium indoltheticum]SUX43831.1 Uncharacterised protein [Chryseobacterium indoltheticum]